MFQNLVYQFIKLLWFYKRSKLLVWRLQLIQVKICFKAIFSLLFQLFYATDSGNAQKFVYSVKQKTPALQNFTKMGFESILDDRLCKHFWQDRRQFLTLTFQFQKQSCYIFELLENKMS